MNCLLAFSIIKLRNPIIIFTQGTTHYNTVIAKYGALFRPYFYATSYMTEYGLL